MRSDELLQRIRLNATLEDNATDYADSVLFGEMNDSLQTTFSRMIVAARAGYWLKSFDYTVSQGVPKYRLPPRALAGALEGVEIGVGSNPQFVRLGEVPQAHAEEWQRAAAQIGQPQKYVVRGDQVVLLPTPDSGTYTIRLWYYLRPSRLVTQQSVALTGFTERGRVTAVNTTARTIVVNVVPFDMELVAGGVIVPGAITTANQRIDVVHPNGWYELALVDATQTLAGTTFTVGGTQDMSEIQVGDYVRAAGQTDWPALDESFHRCLADTTTVKVLAERNMADKASDFAQAVSADIARFQDVILPRVKQEALVIRAPLPGIRGRRFYWPSFP